MILGCLPSGQADVEPVEPASPVEAPRVPATPTPAGPKRPSDPPEPEPAAADSVLPETKVVIGEGVQPGLVEIVGELPRAGLWWVGRLEGNGGRDVLIHVPPGAEAAADFQLVYHFHGTYGEHVEKKRAGLPKKRWVGWNRLQQTLEAAAELQAERDYNVVLVYPFSAGKRREPGLTGWWNKAYDRMWMRPGGTAEYRDSFARLHQEVLEILIEEFGAHPRRLRRPVVAEGHSAGGIALLNIALEGNPVVGEYIFQDAGFQGWADGCWKAVREHGTGARITLVITEGGIADPFGKHDPWCTNLERAANEWPAHERFCRGAPERSPLGGNASCEELRAMAEAWPDHAQWCEALKTNMRDILDVYVHRTRIYHGDQPRHFTGGLELPPRD